MSIVLYLPTVTCTAVYAVLLNPAGPLHVVGHIHWIGTFTNVLSSTVQARIILSDPTPQPDGTHWSTCDYDRCWGWSCKMPEGRGRREEGDGWECRYLIISLYNVM